MISIKLPVIMEVELLVLYPGAGVLPVDASHCSRLGIVGRNSPKPSGKHPVLPSTETHGVFGGAKPGSSPEEGGWQRE